MKTATSSEFPLNFVAGLRDIGVAGTELFFRLEHSAMHDDGFIGMQIWMGDAETG